MAMVASEAQETPLQEALGLLAAAIGKVGLLVGGVCFAVLLIRRGPAVAPPPLAAPRNRALLCQASGSAWLTLRCGWSGAARKPDVEVWGHANGRADNKQPTPGVQVSSRRGRTRTSTAPPGRALLSYPLALAAACATVLRLGGLRRARARSGGACKTAASRWRRSRPGRSHSSSLRSPSWWWPCPRACPWRSPSRWRTGAPGAPARMKSKVARRKATGLLHVTEPSGAAPRASLANRGPLPATPRRCTRSPA